MKIYFVATAIFLLSCASPAFAEQAGTAGGKGTIDRFIPGDSSGNPEKVPFAPRFSFSYREGKGAEEATWIILTEKEPPIQEIVAAKDRSEAERSWCASAKASFVALKLDSKSAVDLYFLCPGNGNVNTEMLSTANGLDSVVVKFDQKTDSRLKGSLTGGQGSCPAKDGKDNYCTQSSDYTFDAPLLIH